MMWGWAKLHVTHAPLPARGSAVLRVYSLKRRDNVNMINVFPRGVWHACGHHHHIGGPRRQHWHWHTIMPTGCRHRDDLLSILQSLYGWDREVPYLLVVILCGRKNVTAVTPLGMTISDYDKFIPEKWQPHVVWRLLIFKFTSVSFSLVYYFVLLCL